MLMEKVQFTLWNSDIVDFGMEQRIANLIATHAIKVLQVAKNFWYVETDRDDYNYLYKKGVLV